MPSEVTALKNLAFCELRYARKLLEDAEATLDAERYEMGWDHVQDAIGCLNRAVRRFEYLRDDH